MSDNLPVPIRGRELEHRSEEQIISLLEYRGEQVEAYKEMQALLVGDLELALNLIKQYQRALNMLQAPDSNTVEARKLLNKYRMESLPTHSGYKILLDGRDITDHPDSIPGSVNEMELEAGDDD